MAIIVVAGSGRNVGKTMLVCGLIAALPEFSWIAVKVTNHAHSGLPVVFEETAAGQGTGTGRYLAAGAQRAFLVTADGASLAERLGELWDMVGSGADVIFESNRVLREVQPDLCIAIEPGSHAERKPTFTLVEHQKHVTVRMYESGNEERSSENEKMRSSEFDNAHRIFYLTNFGQISPAMLQWLREQLTEHTRG